MYVQAALPSGRAGFLPGAGPAAGHPGPHVLAQGLHGGGPGRADPVLQRHHPLPVSLLRPLCPGGGPGAGRASGPGAGGDHAPAVQRAGGLRPRPGPGLCGGIPGGGPNRFTALPEGHVHQDRGRAAARLLQQFRPRLYSGRGGGWGLCQQQGGRAALPGPCRGLGVRGTGISLLQGGQTPGRAPPGRAPL